MKRFILIFALAIALIGVNTVQAQDFTVVKTGVTAIVALDTITDTGTDNKSALLKIQFGEVWGVSVLTTIASLTGTHDIDLEIQSSIDGTNWYSVATATLATTTLVHYYEDINGFTGRYIRVLYPGGAGATQTTTVKADLYVFRIPD